MTIQVLDKDGAPQTIMTIDDLIAVIGAVGVSPAANTLQDRLKAIHTDLATTLAGYVDGLEALIGSTNTASAALATKLDTLHADFGAATVGTTVPGTEATQMVGMQGAAAMVPLAVVGKTIVFPLTPTLDTVAYAAGDVLFDRSVLANLFRITDGTGILQSIQVVDQDDNGIAIDFWAHTTNQTLGTANAVPSITDANAVELLGPFSIASTDYKDLGGCKVGKISNIGQPIKAVSATRDLYISAVVAAGTPTFTASGIKLRIGVLLD